MVVIQRQPTAADGQHRAAATLIQPSPALILGNLTLTAVGTHEGPLTSWDVLRVDTPDANLIRAVSRLASGVRFEPAQVAGSPIAVNVVWGLERTTVAPHQGEPRRLGGA